MEIAGLRHSQPVRPDAKGGNPTRFFWVYLVCGFLGIVNETILVYVANRTFEIHSGLLYIPFVPMYGAAGILMVVLLDRFKNPFIIFLVGAVFGGLFEFLTSFGQEKILGSISWDYSQMPYSIAGRTTLMHMVYWGLLGLVFIKLAYPLIMRLFEVMPSSIVHPATQVLFWAILILTLFTLAAVIRYIERFNDLAAISGWQHWFDRYYPDSVILRYLPMLTQLN